MAAGKRPERFERSDKSISLPYSADAEKAVLGAVLRDPGALVRVVETLHPEHFYVDAHRSMFEAMLELDKAGEPTDIVSVAEKLRRLGSDDQTIDISYLADLTENSPISQNLEHYSQIVRDGFYRRRVIHACQKAIRESASYEGSIDGFIESIEKEFLGIAEEHDKSGLVLAKDVLYETLEDLENKIKQEGTITGVTTGFTDLDHAIGGFQKSDLIILAARPGMGKTALVLNWATAAAKSGESVAIFSLEMAKTQLMMRILASEGKVDSSRLRRGDLGEDEQDRLVLGARTIAGFKGMMAIDETPGISLTELRSRCRRFKKEHGLGLVVIDYLQLMTLGGSKNADSREREISEISMGLKGMAKELSVPVIALAQLNRGPDTRPDKRPKISDLRESGSMEQDADQIFFVYRDEYYNKNSEDAGKAEVIIGKNRHGSTDTIFLAYLPNFVAFHNLMN